MFPISGSISCCQDFVVARCFPPSPESGEVPEDEESEELAEEVSGFDAADEEDETEDDDFIVSHRDHVADELNDTAASSPSTHNGNDADAPSFVDAAVGTLARQAQKRTAGAFADEDSLFSS